jgi:hypothetical protein
MSTLEWLRDSLIASDSNTPPIIRNKNTWIPIAGFSRCGCIFAIYKNKDAHLYCVHTGDDWKEDESPTLGYYDGELSWNELLIEIAKKYDEIRTTITSSS